MSKTKQKRVSIATTICWLLLTIANCHAMIAAPAGDAPADMPTISVEMTTEMASEIECCDPVELACCEPTSSAISYKFDAGENGVAHVAALPSIWTAFTGNASTNSRIGAADWHRYTHLQRLHLLNCSFLD